MVISNSFKNFYKYLRELFLIAALLCFVLAAYAYYENRVFDFFLSILGAFLGAITSSIILYRIVIGQITEDERITTDAENKKIEKEKEKESEILEVHKKRVDNEIKFNYMILNNLKHALTLKPKMSRIDQWPWLMSMCDSFSCKAYDSLINSGLIRKLDGESEQKYYTIYTNIDYIINKINFYNVQLQLIKDQIPTDDKVYDDMLNDVDLYIKIIEEIMRKDILEEIKPPVLPAK